MLLQEYRVIQEWIQTSWQTSYDLDWNKILCSMNVLLDYSDSPEIIVRDTLAGKDEDITEEVKKAEWNLKCLKDKEREVLTISANNQILGCPLLVTIVNHTRQCIVSIPEAALRDHKTDNMYQDLNQYLDILLDSIEIQGFHNSKQTA